MVVNNLYSSINANIILVTKPYLRCGFHFIRTCYNLHILGRKLGAELSSNAKDGAYNERLYHQTGLWVLSPLIKFARQYQVLM